MKSYMKSYLKTDEDKERYLLENVNKLPEELVDIIYSYIPHKVTLFLTKNMYLFNHHLIRNYIKRYDIEEYFRTTIRKDNDFVFKIQLYENYRNWINLKQYYYKGQIFASYLYFINSYCYDNYSEKCIKVINNFFTEQGLRKNQLKKKIIQYIN